MKRIVSSMLPPSLSDAQRENFRNVQLDALGVGLAAGAAPFLSIFLVRLGASGLQVSMVTAMPAITGLLLAIAAGRHLQTRTNVVPWLSTSRLLALLAYTLVGCVPLVLHQDRWVNATLVIWAVSTLPALLVNVSFSVVMSAVAGPRLRYELLSRRWSVLGFTNAVAVAVAGRVLDLIPFPVNYQLVFIVFSLGGLVSYYFAGRIRLPEQSPANAELEPSVPIGFRGYLSMLRSHGEFSRFVAIRLVYFLGATLALPLLPQYYVRVVEASDSWIGLVGTLQAGTMLIGYRLWTVESRSRGSRFVLLATTLGLTVYPVLVALTRRVQFIALLAGLAGIFQAGLDLVFFDELMKTIPAEKSALLVSVSLTLRYLATIAGPLLGTGMTNHIGIAGGLMVSSVIRFAALVLFVLTSRRADVSASA
jgi:hypothetical protein